MKDVNKKSIIAGKKGEIITLQASYIGNYKWNKGNSTDKKIKVTPPVGKTIYEVQDPYNCLKDTFEVNITR
jgi:uncharacterized protein YxjI